MTSTFPLQETPVLQAKTLARNLLGAIRGHSREDVLGPIETAWYGLQSRPYDESAERIEVLYSIAQSVRQQELDRGGRTLLEHLAQ